MGLSSAAGGVHPGTALGGRVAQGALVAVLAHVTPMTFETHALWPPGPHLPLRVRLAIDALAAGLPARVG